MVKLSSSVELAVSATVRINRCSSQTDWRISLGGVLVAKRTVSGRYNERQGLHDFKQNPHAWHRGDGWAFAAEAGLC